MKHCRCRVEEWAKLLAALGWSQADSQRRLAVGRMTLWRMRQPGHYCAHRAVERLLRIYLQSPDLQRQLAEAGIADPWPEDRAK